jgi:hypothetical protein
MICFLKGSWGCRDCAVRLLANATLIATGILATNCVAIAGSDSVGMTITSDPDPDNFGVPKNMKYELNGAHTFDSGLILGGSFQYTDTTAVTPSRHRRIEIAAAAHFVRNWHKADIP